MLASSMVRSSKPSTRRLRSVARCLLGVFSTSSMLLSLLGQPVPTDLKDVIRPLQRIVA